MILSGGPRTRYRGGGVRFAWVDATTGDLLPLSCDDCATTIPIGFELDFYGRRYDQVVVSSNGYLTFEGAGGEKPAAILGRVLGLSPEAKAEMRIRRVEITFADLAEAALTGGA